MPFQKGHKLAKGRPKGSPNILPASVKDAIRDVVQQHREDIEQAMLRGFKSGPPKSYGYLKLAAEYMDGKPGETVDLKVSGVTKVVHEHYWTDKKELLSS